MLPPILPDEHERASALHRLNILDTLPEADFDSIVQLISTICRTPIALVSLVDHDRQWFKARIGLDVCETSRDVSFCAHALARPDDPFIIPDAWADPRFAENDLVTGPPFVRFYAGIPLVLDGHALGSICVIDTVPHHPTAHEIDALRIAARAVVALMRQRRTIDELVDARERQQNVERSLRDEIALRTRAEMQLQHSASHDDLTRLPNRSNFRQRLAEALAVSRAVASEGFAVCFVDLDRFKQINDTLGHAAGDLVLIEAAKRLQRACRSNDFVARLGGDEFTIILYGICDDVDASGIASRIACELAAPFVLDDTEIYVTASVGIAFPERDFSSADDLIRDADIAMLEAKNNGRNAVQIFNEPLRARFTNGVATRMALHRGLQNDEFRLVYQPIVTLADGAVSGFEALMRWDRPNAGPQSPADFIAAAEENGLIVPLGDWALRSACAALGRWHARHGNVKPVSMSVNVSANQVLIGTFGETLEAIVRETGVDPSYVSLEITETAIMRDVATASRILHRLRALGMRVDLDDFGTGYSSLARLRGLPIDRLKIDRTFVSGAGEGLADPTIVRAVIGLAHEFEIGVIAEGVETQAQCEALVALGCDEAQGYLFSRPLEIDAAEAMLAAETRYRRRRTVREAS